MARPLRIEYPNAYYHVSNSGLDNKNIFPSAKYYEAFLQGISETCFRLNVEVHAYCLLRDRYYLLIKTPEGNLSRFMRQVDGLYTQHYQRLKKTRGSLFRGRYKAVLVQAEKYLLPVSRFIHCSSQKAKKPSNLEAYLWSSYAAYINKEKAQAWLQRPETLDQLNAKSKRYAQYAAYVANGVDDEMARFHGKKNLSSILGDDKFRQKAKAKRSPKGVRGISRGSQAKLRPSCKQIVSAVAKQFKVKETTIYKATRGPGSKNIPRWISMYLCQELSAVTLQDIAKLFGLKRYGTVSTTVGKLKRALVADEKVLNVTKRLMKSLRPKAK